MKEGTMAYYSDELIEEVRSRNDVVDVISGIPAASSCSSVI